MKPVRDDDGRYYLLVKRSGDASLVRDPETGNECYVGNDRLEAVEGTAPLETAARAIPEPVRQIVRATPDDRALGLLVELGDRGPRSVRALLDETTYCESDLAGVLATLSAADLVTHVDVAGERGYELTTAGETALTMVRETTDADDAA